MDNLDKYVTEIKWKMLMKTLNTTLTVTKKDQIVFKYYSFVNLFSLVESRFQECSSVFDLFF